MKIEIGWAGCSPIGNSDNRLEFSETVRPPKQGREFADAIQCRGVLERLSGPDVEKWLGVFESMLVSGGLLMIEVADHDRAVDYVSRSDDNRAVVFGTNWKDESNHISQLSIPDLESLIASYGFEIKSSFVSDIPYPMITVVAFKWASQAPWVYLQPNLPDFSKFKKILDVGPGAYPLPWATHFLDNDYSIFPDAAWSENKPRILGSLDGTLPFEDKEFDFVFCSHVFEHLEDPAHAAREISRIGKSGMIVLPNLFKEFMFGWEEDDHIWWALPLRKEDAKHHRLRLMRPNFDYQKKLSNREMSATMCGLFRAGDMNTSDRRTLRKWYRDNEVMLDVVLPWVGKFDVEVVP